MDRTLDASRQAHPRRDPAVVGSRWNNRRGSAILGGLVVAACLLLPLGGVLAAPGMLMEEGFMLLLPQRLAHGAVLYRDFHYFWGPGGLYFPALVGSVFGWS